MEMKDFVTKFKEALEIEDMEINSDEKFKELEEWDSLAVLSILAMVNEEYDIIISRVELDTALTIKDLYDIVKNKMEK